MRSPHGRVRNVVVRSHHATLLVSNLRTACEARKVEPPEVIALSAIGTGSGAPCSNTPPESIHARLGRLADGSIPAPSFPCNPLGMVVERPLNEGVPCSDLGIEAGPLRVFRSPFRPRQRRLPTNSMHRSGADSALASRRPKRLHGTVNPPSNYNLLAQLARRRFDSVSNTSSVSATVVLKSSPLRTARSQETVCTSTSAEMWEVHPLGAAPPMAAAHWPSRRHRHHQVPARVRQADAAAHARVQAQAPPAFHVLVQARAADGEVEEGAREGWEGD